MKKRFRKKDNIYQKPTINADTFDKRRYNELLHMSKGLQKVKNEGKELPFFDQLMGDMWSSFYKNSPQLLDQEDLNPELSNNHQIMERVLNDDLFQETHEYTKLDDLHSALSTVGFSEKVFQWIEEMTDTNKDMQQAYNNMKEQHEQNGEGSEGFQEAMQQFSETLKEKMDQNSNRFSEMLQKTVEETKQTEKNLKDLLSGIESGKGSNEELKQMPLRDQFALAEYLKTNHKMKKIAEWAGRFKAIARSKQKSMSKESISRSGVTIGNEVDRILPSELISLSNPVTKTEFLRRFAEGQTLQYATRGKQSLGKGPIIACLDQSGSMRNIDVQSKGFVLALMSIAKRQKRDFALITFDDFTKVRQYPKGKITTKEMVELCENFMGGGTNFTKPLTQSLNLIKKDRFKNADIVFITDGVDKVSNEFLNKFSQEKKKLEFSVLSLLIGDRAKRDTVNRFSNEIHFATDFQDEKAHEVFNI